MASAAVKGQNSIAAHAVNKAKARKFPAMTTFDTFTTNLGSTDERRGQPVIPAIKERFDIYNGSGKLFLVYLAIGVIKSDQQLEIMRILGSATTQILNSSRDNMFGIPEQFIQSVSVDDARQKLRDNNFAEDEVVNFGCDFDFTVYYSELNTYADVHENELASLFAAYFLAGVKTPEGLNLPAFNDLRRPSVQVHVIGDLKIFTPDSPFFELNVLKKVNSSFASRSIERAHLISRTANKLTGMQSGMSGAFQTIFGLLTDQGMSALRMIKEATDKYGEMFTMFPELAGEFYAAHLGMLAIRNLDPPHQRAYAKAIYGASFVPVKYSDISTLTAVAKNMLSRTITTYAQYSGADAPPAFVDRIDDYFKPADAKKEQNESDDDDGERATA